MSRGLLRPFFGIPDLPHGHDRSGADCWGLARLVYREMKGVSLPDYHGEYLTDRDEAEISAIIRREASIFWTKIETPQFLDLILFRINSHDSHIGIFAEDGWMLHTIFEDCSKFGRYDRFPWAAAMMGFYRFKDGSR